MNKQNHAAAQSLHADGLWETRTKIFELTNKPIARMFPLFRLFTGPNYYQHILYGELY